MCLFLVRGNKVSVQDGKTKSEGGYWEFFMSALLSLRAHCRSEPLTAISYVFFTASSSATPFFRKSVISHCHGSSSPLFCGRRSSGMSPTFCQDNLVIYLVYPSCLFQGMLQSDATPFTGRSIIMRVGLILLLLFFFLLFLC